MINAPNPANRPSEPQATPAAVPLSARRGEVGLAAAPPATRIVLNGVMLSLLALIVAHVLYPPFYQTNDDPGMDLAARGSAGSPPEPHLLFINILLGKLLVALYGLTPALPWYRLFMLAVQATSGAVLYTIFLARGPSRSKRLLVLLYVAAFDLYLYVNAQFTVTAAVAAQAAVMLWLESADRGRRLGPIRTALFLGLLACSVMIRDHSCFMMLLVAIPAVVGILARRLTEPAVPPAAPRPLWTLRTCLLPLALGGVLTAALTWYNAHVYRSHAEWRDVYRYNALKSLIIDTGEIQYTPESRWVFDRVGWSRNDFEMFKSFAYFGDGTFALERLERLVALYRKLPADSAASPSTAHTFDRPSTFLSVFASTRHGAPAKAALLLVPLFFLPWRRDRLSLVALATVGVLAVMGLLYFYVRRCPSRVSDPVLAYFAGMAIFAAEAAPARFRVLGLLRVLGCLAAIGLTSVYLWDQHAGWDDNCIARADFEKELARLQPIREQLFVNWNGALPFQLLPPLGSWDDLRNLRVLSVSSGTRTPASRRLMRRFRIHDFFRALFTRDDVIIIANPSIIKCVIRFADEHYHEKVVVRTVHPVYSRATDGTRTLFYLFTLGREEPR